jgi:hypothetical protein
MHGLTPPLLSPLFYTNQAMLEYYEGMSFRGALPLAVDTKIVPSKPGKFSVVNVDAREVSIAAEKDKFAEGAVLVLDRILSARGCCKSQLLCWLQADMNLIQITCLGLTCVLPLPRFISLQH